MHFFAVLLTIAGGVTTLLGLACAFLTVRDVNKARRNQMHAM